jgi:rhodanese-related sulfurtransferase
MDPTTLKKRLEEGSAVLIGVREPHEHAREHIGRSKARAACRIGFLVQLVSKN